MGSRDVVGECWLSSFDPLSAADSLVLLSCGYIASELG